MSKNKQQEPDKVVVSEKVKQSATKRRKSKKKKERERWAGFIFFVVMVFLSFVLWVLGKNQSAIEVGRETIMEDVSQ